jgi:hypothetical protein
MFMALEPGKTYEMLWDCQFCSTKKLLGKTHRFCPNCGAPQNPAARYYPDDSEAVAVEDHVFVGKDKTCGSCGQLNAGNAEFCQQCGSPLTNAKEATTVDDAGGSVADGASFLTTGSRDVSKEKFDAEMERVGVTKKKNSGINKWVIGGIAAVVLLVIAAIAALFWTKETTALVTGHTWEREIRIDQYDNFTEQSWWDIVPAGDGVIRGLCVEKQRSTRQVPDGEECSNRRVDNGDGTFRTERQCSTKYRSEPVYDDWCTFSGRRWDYERSVTTSGKSVSEAPIWGNVTLKCNGQSTIGCEREAGRSEEYLVHFKGEENVTFQCGMPQIKWESVRVESVWTVRVRVLDKDAADCDTLKPK